MRHPVVIQQRVVTTDAYGEAVETWTTLAEEMADVRMQPGGESWTSGADQSVARLTHRVRLRYRSDVTPLNRVQWNGRILDIESAVDPDGRSRELLLICAEVVGYG